ncbi:hypothetical protein ACTHS0_11860, partial [Neisseria sp. P0013.S009]
MEEITFGLVLTVVVVVVVLLVCVVVLGCGWFWVVVVGVFGCGVVGGGVCVVELGWWGCFVDSCFC